MTMLPVHKILKKAADKCGLERVRFADKNVPAMMSDVTIMPFFGDLRSTVILSTLLLKRYREEAKGSKYFILCSWPGYESIFPYVDEYWSVSGDAVKNLYNRARGFTNNSPVVTNCQRKMQQFFEDVVGHDDLKPYYDNGITQDFFDRFGKIKCYFPSISSPAILENNFDKRMSEAKGKKVFIYPSIIMHGWRRNALEYTKSTKRFWVALVEELIKNEIVPVICQNYLTHDLSGDFVDSIFIVGNDVSHILSTMRSTDLVLDVFSGISRLALIARTPFLACDERERVNSQREYEIDVLCGRDLPMNYIYSFNTIIKEDNVKVWKDNLLSNIVNKIVSFSYDKDLLPSTAEIDIMVPYKVVKNRKMKKLGTKFIKVPKI